MSSTGALQAFPQIVAVLKMFAAAEILMQQQVAASLGLASLHSRFVEATILYQRIGRLWMS